MLNLKKVENNCNLSRPEVLSQLTLKLGRRQVQSVNPEVQLQTKPDSLFFLMNDCNYRITAKRENGWWKEK
jgi:hypothetical protein